MHVLRPDDALLRRAPVQMYIFDLLHQGRDSLLGLPYTERRAGWRRSAWTRAGPQPAVAPRRRGRGAGRELAKGMEGRSASRGLGLPSGPAPGLDQDQERQATGSHRRRLETGCGPPRRHDRLAAARRQRRRPRRYAGHVGTGITQDMLTDLGEHLASLGRDTSPFGTNVPASAAREARWVEPRLVGEVSSPSGPPTGSCASRAGAGGGSTRTPPRCGGKTDRAANPAGRRSRGCRRSASPGCGPASRSW